MKTKKFAFLFACVAAVTAFISCDLGLGKQVDVSTPSVAFTYPPKEAVAAGSFVLAGSCSDDLGVNIVYVTIENTDTNEKYDTVKATVVNEGSGNSAGSWRLEVNPSDFNGKVLYDAKYIANVEATDRAGHKSSTVSLPFTIDNTPPIFIAEKPASFDENNPSTYGSQFKLEGYLIDDTSYVTVAAKIYSLDKTTGEKALIDTFTISDVVTSDSASVEVASANSSDEDIVANFNKLYGEDSSGEKDYVCSLKITDNARVYNDPSKDSEELSGNSTTRILSYDIYSAYMSPKHTNEYNIKLNSKDLKSLLNGTYSGSITEDDINSAVTDIKNNYILDTEDEEGKSNAHRLAFSMDRDANPYYTLRGYEFEPSDLEKLSQLTASTGAKPTLEISAGKNGTLLRTSNITVYLFGPYTKTDVTEEFITAHYNGVEAKYEEENASGTASILWDGATVGKKEPDSKHEITLQLSNISPTKIYLICVTGEDEDGQALVPANDMYYGFSGQSSNIPPSLAISTPVGESNLQALQTVTGTISSSETEIAGTDTVSYTVKVYDMNESETTPVGSAITGTASITASAEDAKTGSWSFTISKAPATGHYYKYEMELTGSIGGVSSKVVKQQFYVDATSPVFVNTSGSSSDAWSQSKNQQLQVWVGSGVAKSSGIKEVSYVVGDNKASGTLQLGENTDENGKTDSSGVYNRYFTTVGLEEGSNQITYTVTDNAGHSATLSNVLYRIDATAPDADNLTVTPANSKLNGTTSSAAQTVNVVASDNLSGISSIDILKNGSVKASASGLTGTSITKAVTVAAASGLYSEGKNTFTVRVTDAAGNITEKNYEVECDLTSPVVTVTSPSAGDTVNKTITLSGKCSDANGIASVNGLYVYNNSAWEKTGTISLNDKQTEWTASLDTTKYSGTIKLNVVFTDSFGNTNAYSDGTSSDTSLVIDQNSDRPVLKLTNIDRTGTKLSLTKTISGTVTDDDGIVQGIWVTEDASLAASSSTYPTTSADNGWKKATVNSTTWSCEAANEGSTTWYFYVLDKAGTGFATKASSAVSRPYVNGMSEDVSTPVDNSSAISFTCDMTAPKVTVLVSHSNGDYAEHTTSFGKLNKDIYLQITVDESVGMDSTAPVSFESGIDATQIGTVSVSGTKYTYIYEMDAIANTAFTEGNNLITVTAKDASGQSSLGTVNVSIDKTPPAVKIISPSTSGSDAVTGAVTMTGTVSDNSSISALKYLVPTNAQIAAGVTSSTAGWVTMPTGATWSVEFASAVSSKDSLMYYVQPSRVLQSDGYGIATETINVYKLPVYFYAEDIAGNSTVITDQYVLVDSDSGKPKAWINTPANGGTTSGTVTVYGGASDNIYVDEVRLQIDADNDGDFDSDDYTALASTTWDGTDVQTSLTGDSDDWYIAASGTTSWKREIDTDKIAQVDDSRTLRIRVKAYDNEGNTREWTTPIEVSIDGGKPVVSGLRLVQYAADGTTETVSREYISGMYINNTSQWYLTGTISDDKKVSSVIFNKIESTTQIINGFTSMTKVTPEAASYSLKCGIPTGVSGVVNVKITAADDNQQEVDQVILVNIDSTPPSLYTTDDIETPESTSSLRIKALGEKLDASSNMVADNNGWFTFGDTVVEAGSGLKYLAFYVQKTVSGSTYVYDPMNSAGVKQQIGADSTYVINSDGLAVMKCSVTRSSEDSLTYSGTANAMVKAGGLVKIGGSYSRIDSVSGNTVTFIPTAPVSYTDVELVLAQVVDHQLVESINGTEITNDDGDGMCESISKLGSAYTWEASVKSTYIADGPAELHVVAIDNADNVTYGTVTTYVSNNRPRITKVLLGTDLDASGKYDYKASAAPVTDVDEDKATADKTSFGEFSYYSAINKTTGKSQSEVELDSSAFKVISGLAIIPEFTGGNTSLGYVMTQSASSTASAYTAKQTGTVTALTAKATILNSTNDLGTYKLTNQISDKGALIISPTANYIGLTFWDKTEGTSQGTTSQWAHLMIPVSVMSSESNKPTSEINPFYWNDRTDSSVYVDSSIAGHIELEDDVTSAMSTLSGTDPKVSGKIKIQGTLYDDVRITEIDAKVFGTTSYKMASYSSGTWTTYTPSGSYVTSFTIDSNEISQAGHTVTYTMVVDTESASTGYNKQIVVTGTDWKSNTTAASSTQTTSGSRTNFYQMDVVPYITEIWTGLSEYSKANASIYSRSGNGNFPVRAGETVKVYGWNFGTSATVTVPTSSSTATVTLTPASKGTTTASDINTACGTKYVSLPVSSSYASGGISVKNGSVASMNNINDDTAAYNSMANGVNNDVLTDTMNLEVWDFKTAASPEGSSASYVHMKVGPYLSDDTNSGRIGFSFKNAIGYFNMPGYRYESSGSGLLLKIKKSYVSSSQYIYMWSGYSSASWPGDLIASTWTADGDYYVLDIPSVSSVKYKMSEGTYSDSGDKEEVSYSGVWNFSNTNQKFVWESSYSSEPVYSQTRMGSNFGGFNYGNFTFDSNGETYGASQCPDTSGVQGRSGNFQFFSRRVGSNDITSSKDLNYNYKNVDNARRIESTSLYKNSKVYTDEFRVMNPEMDTYVSGSTTYVYMIYYDHGLGQVKFRVGSVGSSANTIGLGLVDLAGATGYSGDSTEDGGKLTVDSSSTYDVTSSSYSGYKYVSVLDSSTTSPYVAVGALKTNGTAVAVWYDSVDSALKMKYATLSSVTGTSVSWSSEKTISTVGGKYVSMACDEDGGMHFAYLSNSGADLYYTYLSGVTAEPYTVLVDSYQDVGDRCQITVGRESTSGPWIPYISYKSNYVSHTKIAYPVVFSSSNLPLAGADDSEKFTGNWNAAIVPSQQSSIDDTVSVGVNKDWTSGSGVMYEFPSGTTETASDTGTYTICNATIVYGNGTKNPVVGYAVDEGYIQMAQKQ